MNQQIPEQEKEDRKKLFSICIPVYNNEKNLPITIPYIMEHLHLFENYRIEIVMVNDGSTDNSYEVMKQYKALYPDIIRIATMTRNFGQGACSHACYEIAKGDIIGVISADGQDPFELFADMLVEFEKGHKIVLASRQSREDKGIGILFSKMFHKIIHRWINPRYPEGGFDFVIMAREVLEKYLRIDQVDSMGQLKLLWLGYPYQMLYYTRTIRNSGKSGYKIMKKIQLACGTIMYDSALPIHMFLGLGIFLSVLSLVSLLIGGVLMLTGIVVPTVFYIISVLFLGIGIILTCVSMLGEYLWNQFTFIKNLPRYVINEDKYYEE